MQVLYTAWWAITNSDPAKGQAKFSFPRFTNCFEHVGEGLSKPGAPANACVGLTWRREKDANIILTPCPCDASSTWDKAELKTVIWREPLSV